MYTRVVGSDHELYIVQPDGSGHVAITNSESPVLDPDWSPDGRSIAAALETTVWGVHLLDADGQNARPVMAGAPASGESSGDPSFSPDGNSIVFVGGDGIWLVSADGSSYRRLTRSRWDVDPNFSPDGRWITFVRINPRAAKLRDERVRALFIVRPDGTGLRQLTPYSWHLSMKHDWAPDGRRILVTVGADTARPKVSANLATIRPDGTDRQLVTRFRGGVRHAFAGSYSPDGKQIAFRLDTGRPNGPIGRQFSVAGIGADGRNMRALMTSRALPTSIDWGPLHT